MERLKPSYLAIEMLDGSVAKVLLTHELPIEIKEQLTAPHPGRTLQTTAAANLQVASRAHQLDPISSTRRADLEYSRRLAKLEADWLGFRSGSTDQRMRKAVHRKYRKEVPHFFRRAQGELTV